MVKLDDAIEISFNNLDVSKHDMMNRYINDTLQYNEFNIFDSNIIFF